MIMADDKKKQNVSDLVAGGLVKPDFMEEPSESTITSTGKKIHEYDMPEKAEDVIAALQWMMTVYDDVGIEYGVSYHHPYCNLDGIVREG